MLKLTCLKREEHEPAPRFLLDAINPLKPFWPQCQKTEGWADLNRALNRIIGGVFFESDAERAAELIERLCVAAQASLRLQTLSREERGQILDCTIRAREAANYLRHAFPVAVIDARLVEDVDCERFYRKEARV